MGLGRYCRLFTFGSSTISSPLASQRIRWTNTKCSKSSAATSGRASLPHWPLHTSPSNDHAAEHKCEVDRALRAGFGGVSRSTGLLRDCPAAQISRHRPPRRPCPPFSGRSTTMWVPSLDPPSLDSLSCGFTLPWISLWFHKWLIHCYVGIKELLPARYWATEVWQLTGNSGNRPHQGRFRCGQIHVRRL